MCQISELYDKSFEKKRGGGRQKKTNATDPRESPLFAESHIIAHFARIFFELNNLVDKRTNIIPVPLFLNVSNIL